MVLHVLSVGRHTSYDTTILNVRIVQRFYAHPLIACSMDSFPCRAVLGCAAAGCKAVVASKVRRHKRASSHTDTGTLHNDRKLHAKDAVTHMIEDIERAFVWSVSAKAIHVPTRLEDWASCAYRSGCS